MLDGAIALWPDTKSVFTKNTRSSYQTIIPNTQSHASLGITVKVWCDSPSQSFTLPTKDYIAVELSSDSGSTFTSLGAIHESALTYLGMSVIEGHTG